jgi:putative oxidoreductase
MNADQLLRTATVLARRLRSVGEPLVMLLTRAVIGYAFFVAGRGKFAHFDSTIDFFASLGIPAPAFHAGFIASLEVVGGLALIAGLGTRVFGALLSSTMIVALATAHAAEVASALTVGGKGSLTDITAFVYLLFLAWIVVFGPGPLSADRIAGPWLGRRITATPEAADVSACSPA